MTTRTRTFDPTRAIFGYATLDYNPAENVSAEGRVSFRILIFDRHQDGTLTAARAQSSA